MGLLYTSADSTPPEYMFSPSLVLLTGISCVVLARINVWSLLQSLSKHQKQTTEIEVRDEPRRMHAHTHGTHAHTHTHRETHTHTHTETTEIEVRTAVAYVLQWLTAMLACACMYMCVFVCVCVCVCVCACVGAPQNPGELSCSPVRGAKEPGGPTAQGL